MILPPYKFLFLGHFAKNSKGIYGVLVVCIYIGIRLVKHFFIMIFL